MHLVRRRAGFALGVACNLAACGGSVTPPAADLAAADLAVPMFDSGEQENDGAAAPDGFALVPCGDTLCTAREGVNYCCSSDYGKTGYCNIALAQSCGDGGVQGTACNEPTDCKGAQVCCQRAAMTSAFTCTPHDQCPAERDRLCTYDEDCDTGGYCCPYNPSGPSFRRCTKTACGGDGGA